MTKVIQIVFVSCALCVIPIGCSSTGTKDEQKIERIAYQTLKTTQEAAKVALNTYGVKYRAGKLKQDQIDKVRDAYAKYQTAMFMAIDAANLDMNAITPSYVAQALSEFLAVTNSL